MGEKKILFIKTRKGTSQNGKPYFCIDYIDIERLIAKTDFIEALDYEKINKKMGEKHLVEATGILGVNKYDKVYIADIK